MAITLIAGTEAVKRSDMYRADPMGLVVQEEHRGRRDAPSAEAIIRMADSLLDYGQEQAVSCRALPDNRLLLISGFTRVAAARLIRHGYTNAENEFRQDEQFMIKFVLKTVNDEKALIANIVENNDRNATTPVDDAFNQEKLRERYGYTDAAIAKLYGYKDASKVSKLKKLLTLPRDIQDQVHGGHMSLSSALELVGLDATKRDEVLKEASESGQQLTAAQIRAKVRETQFNNRTTAALPPSVLNDDGNPNAVSATVPNATTDKEKALSMKEVRDFFTKLSNEDDSDVSDLGDTLLAWLRGSAPEEEVMRVIGYLHHGAQPNSSLFEETNTGSLTDLQEEENAETISENAPVAELIEDEELVAH